jgi:ATP-dependent 26S proteasome regulatory subunit
MKRESEDGFANSTLVSSILNLTDGLYADLGQLAIIATYNCDRNLIDPALLRKGRLKAEYRFDKLNKNKAKFLSDKLGKNISINNDMTLADIFNSEEQYSNNSKSEKKSIGFGFGG